MTILCTWDDPNKPAIERLENMSRILSNAANAGEMDEEAREMILSASIIALQLTKVVGHMEGALNDYVTGEQDEIEDLRRRMAQAAWRRGEVTVYTGQREQIPTEQWADNSALGAG